jgi:hypothetical protein
MDIKRHHKSKELIVLTFLPTNLLFRDGKPELQSKVVVGKTLNKTVILSAHEVYCFLDRTGMCRKASLKKKSYPIAKINYLGNTIWSGKTIWCDKTRNHNSLGLVKFYFPIQFYLPA